MACKFYGHKPPCVYNIQNNKFYKASSMNSNHNIPQVSRNSTSKAGMSIPRVIPKPYNKVRKHILPGAMTRHLRLPLTYKRPHMSLPLW